MSSTGILFSGVKALVETVGRTRAHTFAELDTLTSMWTGPTSLADTVPKIGAKHPEYPNMELRATHKVADVALVTRIQLDYVGLFDGGSISVVGTGYTSQESELEWQQEGYYATGQIPFGVQYGPQYPGGEAAQTVMSYKVFLQNYITRYVSRSTVYRYAAKNASAPRFSGGSILSVTTRMGAQSNVTTATAPLGHYLDLTQYRPQGVLFGYHTEVYCSSFNAEPISPSWFRCTETWGARLVPGPSA